MKRVAGSLTLSIALFAGALAPCGAATVAETQDVFKRCLAKSIDPDVRTPDLAGGPRVFLDPAFGIQWKLPPNFRIVARNEGNYLFVAASKSNTFGVVLEKPSLHDGRTLDAIVKDYAASLRASGTSRILSRKSIRFGGLPAVRLYVQTQVGGKITCTSEVFVRRGAYVFQLSILQRLYQGYCISDVLIGSVMSDWSWIQSQDPAVGGGR